MIPTNVMGALGRLDMRAVVGHFSWGIHEHVKKPWTYVTMLRHPVERVMSLYYHVRKEEYAVARGLSLEDFVSCSSRKEVDNDQTRRISGLDPEFGACSTFTLDRAKENLRRHVSVVGVTEYFDETAMLIKRTFGWVEENYYLPNLVNRDKPSSATLPRKSIDTILEQNELDAKLWEFAKELLDEKIARQGPAFHEELRRFKVAHAAYIATHGVPNW